MRVFIGQIYIKPGVDFPFSHQMQGWLGEQLSSMANPSAEFVRKYGADFALVVRVSADTGIVENRIKGPTIFKKTRDVEYTVFLPFDVIDKASDGCRVALDFLLRGIESVFHQAGIDAERLPERKASILDHICSDASMFTEPWSNEKKGA